MDSLQRDWMIETFYFCGIKKTPLIKRLLDRAHVEASERTIQRKINVFHEKDTLEEEKTSNKGRPSSLSEEEKMEIEGLLEEHPTLNSKEIMGHLTLDCASRTVNSYLNSQEYKWKQVRNTFMLEERQRETTGAL